MINSATSNIYDYFVQKCIINGLKPEKVRQAAGVSHQVLSSWKKKDPKTMLIWLSLLNQIELQAGSDLINDGWTMANSGTMINVFDPKPEMFLIEDIAEGLSYKYRWCGQSSAKITVAQHSVWVASRCFTIGVTDDALAGLLHDASEAYMSDIPSPIKSGIPEYKRVEGLVMACIAEKFGFEWPLSAIVKGADAWFLEVEFEMFNDKDVFFMHPDAAKCSFLEQYMVYTA